MKPKLTLVNTEMDLRNVVFLGDARFSSVAFKLVEKEKLSLVDKANIVCEQTCGCTTTDYANGPCKDKGPCIFVIVRRTSSEKEARVRTLERIYPLTDFSKA